MTTAHHRDHFQAPTFAPSLAASTANVGGEIQTAQDERNARTHSIMNGFTSAGWMSLTALLAHTVYTLGYRAKGAMEQVEMLVREHDAMVLDIRTMPRSLYYPQWNRKQLEARFGLQHYDHLELLGNVNYPFPDRPIQLQDAQNGLLWLCVYLQRRDVVLLCGCPCLSICHRSHVCQLLHRQFPALSIAHLITRTDGSWDKLRHDEVQA